MSDLFVASLQEYEKQTGIALLNHPFAEQLRYSDPAGFVAAILQEQLPVYTEFGGIDRITKSLSSLVSVLYTLPVSFNLYLARPKVLIGLFHLSYSLSLLRNQYMPGWLSYSLYVPFLLHSYVRIFLTSKYSRLSRTLSHSIHLLIYSSRLSPF